MRYRFILNGKPSHDTFASRDAALTAGLLMAGCVITGVQTVVA